MAIIEFVERDMNAKGLLDKERLKLEAEDSSKTIEEKKIEDKVDNKKLESKPTKEKVVKEILKDKNEESKK